MALHSPAIIDGKAQCRCVMTCTAQMRSSSGCFRQTMSMGILQQPPRYLGDLTTNDKTGLGMAGALMSKTCLESTPLQFESFAWQLPRC
jgi:hypothetical protein